MNNNTTNNQSRPSREGAKNPMFGRHHSDEARRKQSEAARKRNERYREALNGQHHVSMDELLGNPKMQEYITHLVRQQIREIVWNKQKKVLQ